MQWAFQLGLRKRHMSVMPKLRCIALKQPLRNALQWVKTGPRLSTSVLLMLFAIQAMGSEALKMVYEVHSFGGTDLIAIFEDGATYHAHIPEDATPQPDGCTNGRTISLSWLSGYDYAKVRSGEPAIALDPDEVKQHWRTIIDGPIDYAAEARKVDHTLLSCAFVVVANPIRQLHEMRLVHYNSWFYVVRPRSSAQRATVDWLGTSLGGLIRKVTADSLQPRLHHPLPHRQE